MAEYQDDMDESVDSDMGADMDDADDKKKNAENDGKLLTASREGLTACIEREGNLRKLMEDDLRFATLDQWPADIRADRENDILNGARPCLTIDQINQYITQVSNEMRSNRPSIKTRPADKFGDAKVADIYQDLIRHIEYRSNAKVAYQTGGDSAVTIGLGFIRVVPQFVSPDSYDQELVIKRVPDTFQVYLSDHAMPDGSDAEEGWVFEKVPLKTFKREWPNASADSADFVGLGVVPTWINENDIIVCEYYYKHYEKAELLFLENGEVVYADEYKEMGEGAPAITGRRDSHRVTVRWCKHTGYEILDKRVMKGKYIPIVEVVGKEKIVDGKRVLWGLVRPAKDSLRAYNYWISAMVEKMALAPKAPWIGAVGQFNTQPQQWKDSNRVNYAVLQYDAIDVNGNAVAAPMRQPPIPMENGMAQVLGIMQNNVKSSLGMYKAALGEAESQQSGKAILALKRESDTGTMHFGENQALAIEQVGRILIDLIPHYYPKKQVIRILGEDGTPRTAMIDPEQKEAVREIRQPDGSIKMIYNLGVGTYDVYSSVGPGYQTSRQEAATVMTDLANTAKDPVSAAIMRYGAIKNSDFSGSDEITKMLKAMLPPQLQSADDEQEPIPAQAMQKIQQLQQAGQALQAQAQEIAQENQQLKSGAQESQAKIAAAHEEKMAQLALEKEAQDAEIELARQKAQAEINIKRWTAEQNANIDRMKAVASADGDIDSAVMKIQSMAEMSLAKMGEAAQPEEPGERMDGGENAAAMQNQFLAAVQEIVAGLQAKKSINLVRRDGQVVGADVTVQQ